MYVYGVQIENIANQFKTKKEAKDTHVKDMMLCLTEN